jgi:hypothetical protein
LAHDGSVLEFTENLMQRSFLRRKFSCSLSKPWDLKAGQFLAVGVLVWLIDEYAIDLKIKRSAGPSVDGGLNFNPDSAVEIDVGGRARREPGAAKTRKRIVSTPCLVLGSPLRFIARN